MIKKECQGGQEAMSEKNLLENYSWERHVDRHAGSQEKNKTIEELSRQIASTPESCKKITRFARISGPVLQPSIDKAVQEDSWLWQLWLLANTQKTLAIRGRSYTFQIFSFNGEPERKSNRFQPYNF